MRYDGIKEAFGISYGFVRGGEKIAFIKAGLGGNHFGCEDRYLKMACRLRDKYGFSVIVASNPNDGRGHAQYDRAIIEEYAADCGISSPRFLFFGHSNGCVKGLELSASGLSFEKMVLVNMPLMVNFHRIKRYISAIPSTNITLVFGELDPSYSYLPFIRDRYENARVLTVDEADHNFKGFTDGFILISDALAE